MVLKHSLCYIKIKNIEIFAHVRVWARIPSLY